jgi:glutathione S-transferase
MIKIYGWRKSRAVRCMWVLEELGVDYQQVPLKPHAGETKTPEYLAMNPAGKIPTLDHDGFVLSETVAINHYLASTLPGSLLPADPRGQAKVLQWTSWAISDLEPQIVAIMREGRRPERQADASRVAVATTEIHDMIDRVLEPVLAGSEYLLETQGFTLADLNVASVASSLGVFGISLQSHAATDAWLKRCFARPAWQRAQAKP